MLGKADTMVVWKLILQLIPRISFFFYWILDTFVVLGKIKFLNNLDMVTLQYRWAACWTTANITTVLNSIVSLVEINKEEQKFRKSKVDKLENEDKKRLQTIKSQKFS